MIGADVNANPGQAAGQITLVDGKPSRLAADLTRHSESALAPAGLSDPANKDNILVTLDFAAEPRIRWSKALAIRVIRATDDQGQVLAQTLASKPNPR